MKFTVKKHEIMPLLLRAARITNGKNNMPILNNVLMKISGGRLYVSATDTENSVKSFIDVDADDAATTVPAIKMRDIIDKFPDDADIKLVLNDDKLLISAGRSRFSLSTLPHDLYPDASENDYDFTISVDFEAILSAINKSLFCTAKNDVRYYLNGILIKIGSGKMSFIASDAHRLAVFDIDYPCDHEAQVLITNKCAAEMIKLFGPGELSIDISKNRIRAIQSNIEFSSVVIDAKYPDFSKAFCQKYNEPAKINTKDMLTAISRVGILSNEKYHGLTIDLVNDSLSLKASNENGDGAEDLVSTTYNDESCSFGVNAKYIYDAVSKIDSEEFLFSVAKNSGACLVSEPGNDQYKFLVMAMRI